MEQVSSLQHNLLSYTSDSSLSTCYFHQQLLLDLCFYSHYSVKQLNITLCIITESPKYSTISIYVVSIPKYENEVCLGAKWIITLWKASTHDVWWCEESCRMPEHSLVFSIALLSCSLSSVSSEKKGNIYTRYSFVMYLRGLIHFFLLYTRLCAHLGKSVPWPWCLLWIWFTTESHFASIIQPLPSSEKPCTNTNG